MMTNLIALFGSAIIPLLVGAIWFSPKVFGNAWMRATEKTKESLESGNMLIIFGLTYILGVFLAVGLSTVTNHQAGLMQLFATHPDFAIDGSDVKATFDSIMTAYGDRHRTFGHGAAHGGLAAFFFALPIIAIVALFERRGAKYIGIHFGYWLVTMILMGGVVCQFM